MRDVTASAGERWDGETALSSWYSHPVWKRGSKWATFAFVVSFDPQDPIWWQHLTRMPALGPSRSAEGRRVVPAPEDLLPARSPARGSADMGSPQAAPLLGVLLLSINLPSGPKWCSQGSGGRKGVSRELHGGEGWIWLIPRGRHIDLPVAVLDMKGQQKNSSPWFSSGKKYHDQADK